MKSTLVWIGALAAAIATGCGTGSTRRPSASADTVSAPFERVLVVVADGFRLRSVSHAAPGPARVRFFNRGGEAHRIQVIRLPHGVSPAQLSREVERTGAIPPWAPVVGGSGLVGPGRDVEVGVLLEPGRYVLLCALTFADGRTHQARGLIRPVGVGH